MEEKYKNFYRGAIQASRWKLLPSVWSNTALGIIWSGNFYFGDIIVTLFSSSCLFIAGMWLNDAVDFQEDKKLGRMNRPVVAGLITTKALFILSSIALITAIFSFFLIQKNPFIPLALGICIIIYTIFHQKWTFSVFFMGFCRGLLLILGANAFNLNCQGISLLFPFFTLTLYVTFLTWQARQEIHNPRKIKQTRLLLRCLPIHDLIWYFILLCAFLSN